MAERILVIEDDSGVADALKRGLAYEGYVVDVASTGKEGLEAARERLPDLIILDVGLPDVDGLEVCRRLRSVDNQLPVLMLTARDSVLDQILGLDTGADDYLTKPFVFDVLFARVRACLRRHEACGNDVLRYEDLSLDTATRMVRRGEREIRLTTTEYALLHLFLANPMRVLTRAIILEKVWDYDFDGNDNILDVYVRYLRSKLEEQGEQRLIQTVRGTGYVLRDRE